MVIPILNNYYDFYHRAIYTLAVVGQSLSCV